MTVSQMDYKQDRQARLRGATAQRKLCYRPNCFLPRFLLEPPALHPVTDMGIKDDAVAETLKQLNLVNERYVSAVARGILLERHCHYCVH